MLIIVTDINGNKVEIDSEQIGSILEMAYYGEYEGNDTIEDFISWFSNGCNDDDNEG